MINVSDAAKAKFLEIVEAEGRQGQGLRITVQNGGTPEPEFALNFVEPGQAEEGDEVFAAGEMKVHMDPASAKYLADATIDFVDHLGESGFKVDAPNAGTPKPSGPDAEAVAKVLTEKINPAVAMHGGHVSLVAVEEGTAYLRFGGG
jgi:Fe/S biogenesis protein NfuA